jgi:hypothetical protein
MSAELVKSATEGVVKGYASCLHPSSDANTLNYRPSSKNTVVSTQDAKAIAVNC